MEAVVQSMPELTRSRWRRSRRRSPDVEERRLAKALARQDEAAMGMVEARFGRALGGFLREALPDPATAEEVRQQVLLEIWRRGPQYEPERASLLTWMLTIARSRAIDERRRRRPEPLDPTIAADRAEQPASGELDQLLERWRLAAYLARIPAEEATALRLRFYGGLSQTEIAERMEMSLGTVKMRMVSGLARMRELIAEEERAR